MKIVNDVQWALEKMLSGYAVCIVGDETTQFRKKNKKIFIRYLDREWVEYGTQWDFKKSESRHEFTEVPGVFFGKHC